MSLFFFPDNFIAPPEQSLHCHPYSSLRFLRTTQVKSGYPYQTLLRLLQSSLLAHSLTSLSGDFWFPTNFKYCCIHRFFWKPAPVQPKRRIYLDGLMKKVSSFVYSASPLIPFS